MARMNLAIRGIEGNLGHKQADTFHEDLHADLKADFILANPLYGRTSGTRMAMDIAGHRTLKMHHYYTPLDAEEKLEAGRRAFANLRVLQGGKRALEIETGTRTGTAAGPGAEGAS